MARVIVFPPPEFSPLATTSSMRCVSIIPWSLSLRISLPGRPTISPIARILKVLFTLFCILYNSRLADYRYFYDSRIFQLRLHLPPHVPGYALGLIVAHQGAVHDYAELPPGLDRIALFNALKPKGDLLQVVEPFEVGSERFLARPRPGG